MRKIVKFILCFSMLFALMYIEPVISRADNSALESKWAVPPVAPPQKHPRIYFTADKIEHLKRNFTAEENSAAKVVFDKRLSESSLSGTIFSQRVLDRMSARAYYYALYGDATIGKQAVEMCLGLPNWTYTAKSDISRQYGSVIYNIALVYDWCNNLLGDEDKQALIDYCIELSSLMETGWPPSDAGAVTGHGSEAMLLRDLLAFSIAVYNERPDIWNYVGGRFYEEYVPVREYALQSHFPHQGSDYGSYRIQFDSYAYLLITGMGADEPYSGKNLSESAFSSIYMRRPDGIMLSDGDIYTDTTPPFKYQTAFADNFLMQSYIGSNPFIKSEYFRSAYDENNGKKVFNNDSALLSLIFNNPELKTSELSSLPLSRYFGYPSGVMIARTGWESGEASDDVCVMMKVGERQFNNHQHLDSGHFEIYYKGLLAADSGNYNTYGDSEHYMYTIKSIAHNTMLVYDPEESQGSEVKRGNITDGGQRAPGTGSEFNTLDKALESNTETGKVVAYEIDKGNKPEYTYLKGDLTDAYTDKVSEFERSFMFLNLDREEAPAALIVFDKVTSSDARFKKTWLLHSTEKPLTDGTTSTVINDRTFEDDTKSVTYNGQLTLKTLLPKEDNFKSEIIGNEEDGWGIVRGYKYNEETGVWDITESTNYSTEADPGDDNERNTYRLEISPKVPAQTDYFLNVMLISDAGKITNSNLPLIEADAYYGTVVYDRAVFFAKNGEVSGSFSVEVPYEGNYSYTICDVSPGTYKITAPDGEFYSEATEEGMVLSFEASGGTLKIEPYDSEIPKTEISAGVSFEDNTITAVAEISNAYHPNVYCGVYSEERLVAVGIMNKTDSQIYHTKIDIADGVDFDKVKFFVWNTDSQPLTLAYEIEFNGENSYTKSTVDGVIEAYGNEKTTLTTNDTAVTAVFASSGGIGFRGTNGINGYMLPGGISRVTEAKYIAMHADIISSDTTSVKGAILCKYLNGTIQSNYRLYTGASVGWDEVGSVDVIIDMQEKKAYFYENGILRAIQTLDFTNADFTRCMRIEIFYNAGTVTYDNAKVTTYNGDVTLTDVLADVF